MQPNENYSIPRRAMDVEDYIDILRRHKGWIFGPFLFTVVASVVGVYLYPDNYLSQAVVKIVPQQVPQNMVQSAINQQMSDRINSMAQTILSRTVLTTIINTFNLYQRERSRMPIEDVIELMKKDIQILPVSSPTSANDRIPAFAVTFSYENRLLAQRVVQDLVSRFIDENIRNRSNATFQTTQFIKDQLDDAKKQLDESENKLASFRMVNNGRLPDQVDSNMRSLSALQSEATFLNSQISRANQDKLQLESNIRIMKDQLNTLTKDGSPATAAAAERRSERLQEAERDIQTWENQLSSLRQHYKDSHPDVQNAIGQLELARKRRDQIASDESAKKPEAPVPSAAPVNGQTVREARELDANIRRLQSALEGRDLEIQDYVKQMKRSAESIKAYQGRIETVPLGEKQYADLMRDRDLAKDKFIDLSEKLGKAEIAQEMEGRKQGETLELLDPASLPTTPTEPKRPLVIALGAALGLMLGVVIAAAREMKDTSLKNLKDVRAYTQMAILGSIPLLENDFVVRRRRRLAWLGWTTACLAAAVVMSGSVVYYYVTKV
jgi:polysaccharide chain length determinant protein (PEP-CTERM system associated)